MSNYYIVEPEVAGGWGENTQVTRVSGQPVKVDRLHHIFDGWLGDELIESTPCYIGTERLADAIRCERLQGVQFDDVEVTKSEQFEELYPSRELPKFLWLKVDGAPGKDDFGVTPDLMLVVSRKALDVLKNVGLSNATIGPFVS